MRLANTGVVTKVRSQHGGAVKSTSNVTSRGRFSPIDDPAVFDEALNKLILSYADLTVATSTISFVSLWPLVMFYAKCLWWEMRLIALPIFLIVDIIICLFARISGRKFKSVSASELAAAKAPFDSLHAGEVPIVKFLVLRSVVKLFIYFKLRRNLIAIILRLKEAEVGRFGDANSPLIDIPWHEQRIALLKNLLDVLGEKLGYTLIVAVASASSVIGVAKAVYPVISDHLETLLTFIPYGIRHFVSVPFLPLLALNPNDTSIGSLIIGIFTLVIYICWTAITNFIEMRRLCLSGNLYDVESICLRQLELPATTEIPFDLIGLTVLSATFPIVFLSFEKSPDDKTAALSLIIFPILFLYGLYRRRLLEREKLEQLATTFTDH